MIACGATALTQARVRQFDEGARAVREPLAFWRQAVLFQRAHLSEGAVRSVGFEQWIVAEALIAARRPHRHAVDASFEFFQMAIGPGETERGDEMRAPLLGRL